MSIGLKKVATPGGRLFGVIDKLIMSTPSCAACKFAATTSAAKPPKLLYSALYTSYCARGAIPLALPNCCSATTTGIPWFPAAMEAVCLKHH
nr:hypothetical protein Iba_chr06bCG14390 [Ipomoea batatas]GME03096.1 hypothetical protein Iba_scaffold446CG0440 [Ipomoea batatas]